MQVKCTGNVCASGKALEAGKSYDISEADYQLLASMGKVIKAPPKAKTKKTVKN